MRHPYLTYQPARLHTCKIDSWAYKFGLWLTLLLACMQYWRTEHLASRWSIFDNVKFILVASMNKEGLFHFFLIRITGMCQLMTSLNKDRVFSYFMLRIKGNVLQAWGYRNTLCVVPSAEPRAPKRYQGRL